MTDYHGYTDAKGDVQVYRTHEGVRTPLPLRLDLRNHSPTGFNYGYAGSGPAQLALAILADHMGDERAKRIYQDFKFKVIARLPQGEPWHLSTREIDVVLSQISPGQGRGR